MTKTDDNASKVKRDDQPKQGAPVTKAVDESARKFDEGARKVADGDARSSIELRAVIDRTEGDIAVLSLDDAKTPALDVPLSRLPAGATDGDHLRVTFAGEPDEQTLTKAIIDADARAAAADRVKQMQERLERLSGTAGKKDFKL